MTIRKSLLALLSIIISVVVITNLIIYKYTSDILLKKTLTFETVNMNRTQDLLKSYFAKVNKMMDSMVYNSTIQNFLIEQDQYNRNLQVSKLRNIILNNINMENTIKDIALISKKDFSYTIGSLGSNTQQIIDTYSKHFTTLPYKLALFTSGGKDTILIFKPVYRYDSNNVNVYVGDYIGVCIFQLDIHDFWNSLNNSEKLGAYSSLLLDNTGTVLVQSTGYQNISNPPFDALFSAHANNLNIITYNKQNYLLVSKEIGASELIAFSIVPVEAITNEFQALTVVTFSIFLFGIIVIIIVYLRFIKEIKVNLSIIMNAMKKASNNNLDVRAVVKAKNPSNEFRIIATGFNTMLEKISKLHSDNLEIKSNLYQREIETKNAQLLALQSQVNPHFLYNTLDCIKSIGVYYKINDLASIATSLAFMFKYNVKGERIVTVSEELACIRHYIEIQNIRFPGKLEIVYHIEDSILSSLMPKFILQPLIENSYIHGIEPKIGTGQIILSIFNYDDKLCIVVRDDGVGINESDLIILKNTLCCINNNDTQKSCHIGLSNIAKRIKLYYNNQGTINIESDKTEGTLIKITIPLKNDIPY